MFLGFCCHYFPSLLTHLLNMFLSKLGNIYEIKKKFCLLAFSLEKAMAPHSSTLAWQTPWTEEPGGLQSLGSLRVGHD